MSLSPRKPAQNGVPFQHWLRTAIVLVLVAGLIITQLPSLKVSAEPAVDPERSIFGVQMYEYSTEAGATELAITRAAWARGFELVWSELQPNSAADVVNLPDELVTQLQAARTAGLEPILTVRGTPTWAQKYEDMGSFCGPIKDTELESFANFLIAAIDKLPAGAEINYLEIWNEPDVAWEDVSGDRIWGGCWGEKSDTEFYGGEFYAEMLQVVYPAVKASFPAVQILVGGLQMECDPNLTTADCNPTQPWKLNSTRFFDGILAGGGGPFFDGVSFHAYDYDSADNPRAYANTSWNTAWNSTGPVLAAKYRYLVNTLAQYGVTGKYLMSTENSLLSNNWQGNEEDAAFEQTKAGYLLKSYALSLSLGLKANLWFEMVGRWDKGAGLISPDRVPSPAYWAFYTASYKLYDVVPLGALKRNPLIAGYEFRTPAGGLLWVIWSADGADHVVDLGVDPQDVLDIYGTRISGQDNPLTIGYQPLYVELPNVINRQYVPSVPRAYYPFQNGGFETGLAGWRLVESGLSASSIVGPVLNPITGLNDAFVPTGERLVRLGNPDYACYRVPLGFAAVEQTISVPDGSDIDQVSLSFDYIIYTQDISAYPNGSDYDRFEVVVASGNNQEMLFSDANTDYGNQNYGCQHWRRVPGVSNERGGQIDGWATGTIDLTEFKGLNIRLSFQNHSRYDANYNTYTYLDNVRLVTTP